MYPSDGLLGFSVGCLEICRANEQPNMLPVPYTLQKTPFSSTKPIWGFHGLYLLERTLVITNVADGSCTTAECFLQSMQSALVWLHITVLCHDCTCTSIYSCLCAPNHSAVCYSKQLSHWACGNSARHQRAQTVSYLPEYHLGTSSTAAHHTGCQIVWTRPGCCSPLMHRTGERSLSRRFHPADSPSHVHRTSPKHYSAARPWNEIFSKEQAVSMECRGFCFMLVRTVYLKPCESGAVPVQYAVCMSCQQSFDPVH